MQACAHNFAAYSQGFENNCMTKAPRRLLEKSHHFYDLDIGWSHNFYTI